MISGKMLLYAGIGLLIFTLILAIVLRATRKDYQAPDSPSVSGNSGGSSPSPSGSLSGSRFASPSGSPNERVTRPLTPEEQRRMRN